MHPLFLLHSFAFSLGGRTTHYTYVRVYLSLFACVVRCSSFIITSYAPGAFLFLLFSGHFGMTMDFNFYEVRPLSYYRLGSVQVLCRWTLACTVVPYVPGANKKR